MKRTSLRRCLLLAALTLAACGGGGARPAGSPDGAPAPDGARDVGGTGGGGSGDAAGGTGAGGGTTADGFTGGTTGGGPYPTDGSGQPNATDGPASDAGPTDAAADLPIVDPGPEGPGLCDSGWCWSNQLPQGNNIVALWGSSPSDVWAAAGRTVLHWDGTRWRHRTPPVNDHWISIWGTGPGDVWVMASGRVVRWNGQGWLAPTETNGAFRKISGTAPDDVWVVGAAGSTAHWDGARWTKFPTSSPADLRAVHARARNDVWAAGDAGVVLDWDGARWMPTPTTSPASSIGSIWASAADEAWLALDQRVWRWNGNQWTDTGKFAPQDMPHMWGTGPRDVWMFGIGAMRWDGTDWRAVPVRGARAGWINLAGWVSATGEVWIGGNNGHLGRGNNQEITTITTGLPEGNLRSVWSSGAGDAIAVGDFAARWDGQSWQAIPAGRALNAVWGTSPTSVWAVGDNGLVMFWNGQAWSVLTTGIPSSAFLSFNTITGTGPSDIWAFGRSGNHAHFDGQRWTSGLTAAVGTLSASWASGPGDVWAAAENGSIIHRNGTGWDVLRINHPDARRLTGIWGNSNTDLWVLGNLEQAFHWDGLKFTPVTVPGGGLTAIGGGGPDQLWIATDWGGLFHWEGAAWKPLYTLAARRLSGVWVGRDGQAWAVGDGAAILHRRAPR